MAILRIADIFLMRPFFLYIIRVYPFDHEPYIIIIREYKKLKEELNFMQELRRVKKEIESCIILLLQKEERRYSTTPLSTKTAIIYSLPNAAYNTILAIIVNFTLIYYINIMGQPPLIIGSILSITLFIYALMNVFWGAVADKIGKKKVLWIGGPLLAVSSVFIWMPPLSNLPFGTPYLALILWFAFFSILFRVAGAAFQTSIYALLPELCSEEKEQVKISMINMLMMTVGTLIGVMGIILMMGNATKDLGREDSQLYYLKSPVGKTIYFQVILLSLVICIAFLVFFGLMQVALKDILVSSKRNPFKNNIINNLMDPFKDKNYRLWLIAYFFLWIPFIAFQFLILSIATFVLKLRGDEFGILALSVLPAVVLSFILWQKFSIRLGLKRTYSLCLFIGCAAFFSISLFIIPMSHEMKFILGIILIFFILCSLVGVLGLSLALVSKLMGYAIKNTKKNLSGSYSGAFMMVGSFSAASAMLFISLLLQTFGVENPISYVLIFIFGAILILIAVSLLQKIKIK